MKKLILLLCLALIGCAEDKNKSQVSEEAPVTRTPENPAEASVPEKAILCFLTTENEFQAQNKTLRDSTILNLELTGEVVTGSLSWIPAEKDSRRGVIRATKTGEAIKGNFAFEQEGIQDTVSIEILLEGSSAVVTTLSDSGEEMRLEVERVDCQ